MYNHLNSMNTTTDLTGPLLREVARLYIRAQRSRIACCDGASNVQSQVLTELLRNEEMTQRALVERLNLDKGWISRAVDALVAEGAVAKRQSEVDRRNQKLSLTVAGRLRARKLEQQLNGHATGLMRAVPVDRHAQVQESLQLLLKALQHAPIEAEQKAPCDAWNGAGLEMRAANVGDWSAIEDLLRDASLPLDGAREHLGSFLVGTVAGEIVCAGGLEIYGANALVRSVVVAEQRRGLKVGFALIAMLMQLARERGVTRLFLLTTTAASYFGALGFLPAARDEVPEAVMQSREFQGACPASATLLTAQTEV